MTIEDTTLGEVNSYTLVHTGSGGDGKRWRCGPGGPTGSSFPNGEQGYGCGEYEVHENQTLRGAKALADAKPWCVGFVFKHTDSHGTDPEFRLGTCYLVSRLVVGGTRVSNLDSYLKESTPCLQRIKESFQRWDKTASGLIAKEELSNVMTSVWPDASEKDLGRLIQFADKSPDGKIRYAEFIEWLWGGCSEGLLSNSPKTAEIPVEASLPQAFQAGWQKLEGAVKQGRDPLLLQRALEEAQKAAEEKFKQARAALEEIAVLEAPIARAECSGNAALLREEIEAAKKAEVRSSRIEEAQKRLETIEATLKPIVASDETITSVQAAMEWASSELLRAQVKAKNAGAEPGAEDATQFQKCRQALAFYRLKAVIGAADDPSVISRAMQVCQAVGVQESDLELANRCVATLKAVDSTDDQVEEACSAAALQDADYAVLQEWVTYVCAKGKS